MTIPRLNGWWDEAGAGLTSLADSIGKLNPRWNNEQALREAVQKDPAALQKLRDLEANSPGTLARLYGGGTQQNIMGINESPESAMGRQVTGARATALQDPEKLRAVAEQPVTAALQGEQELRGTTAKANVAEATQQSQIDIAGYTKDLARLEYDTKLDTQQRELLLRSVREKYSQQGRDVFDDLFNGKLSQGEQEALLADEGTWRGIQAKLTKWQEQQQNNRSSNSLRFSTYSNVLPTARQIWSQAKTGDVMSYVQLLSDPATMQRVTALESGTVKPESESDKRLLAAWKGFGKIESDQQQALMRQALNDVLKAVTVMDSAKEFKKLAPGQRQLQLSAINEQLSILGQYTDRSLTIRFKPDQWGPDGGDRIELVDGKTGKVIPLDKIDTDAIVNSDPFEDEAVRLLTSSSNNLTAARATVTGDARLTPDQKAQLLRALDRQYQQKQGKQ